jgi:AraC-like DNA-binding protein
MLWWAHWAVRSCSSIYDTVVDMAAGGVSAAALGEATPEEEALAARVGEVLDDPELLADDTLTLTRVARWIGAPARPVSLAVNRVTGGSFSDLLNDRRVARSVHLMKEDPERALLDIMLAAGYATKSNFYKPFKRRTGRTPAAFRAAGRKRRPTPADPGTWPRRGIASATAQSSCNVTPCQRVGVNRAWSAGGYDS